jgi:uncharacterized protein YwqG
MPERTETEQNQGMSGPRGCLAALAVLAVGSASIFWRPVVGVPLTAVALFICWRALGRATALEKAKSDAERARLAAVGPPVGDVWRRLLALEGLGELAGFVAPHVRPAVRLLTEPTGEPQLGRSRVGGTPDLPADVAWPRHRNVPLAFLAQLNLVEVSAAAPAGPLPRTGHLWFFCDAARWDFSTAGSAVVLYRAGSARLQAAAAPDDLPSQSHFKCCSVTMEFYEDMPDDEAADWLWTALGDDEGRTEAYSELREYLNAGANEASPHKLLGFANTIQGTMESECVPAAHDWQLLLQVDSDGNAGMMWGDAGRVYFWIRVEDLRAARFDRTCTVLQCY